MPSTFAFVIADSVTFAPGGGGSLNGAKVYGYKASRFGGTPPVYGQPPPAGPADAGPTTTGENYGGPGHFQLSVPTNDQYYVLVQLNGANVWQLYTSVLLGAPQSTQFQSALDMGLNQINNLASPSLGNDAVNLSFMQSYVASHGGGGGDGGLSSFTSPNGTIAIAGSLTAPTVDVVMNTIAIAHTQVTDWASATSGFLTSLSGALLLTGGTMSGPIAMGASKITGLANGSGAHDAAAFGQIPTSLPPSGPAGGVLTGTYPNPSGLTTAGVSAAGAALTTNNLSDLASVMAALSNLKIPRLMAPAYGVVANGTDQTALLNSLIEYAASLGGAVIQMPRGLVTVAGPVLMQQGVYLDWGISNSGSTLSAGLIRAALSASDLMQFQCYLPVTGNFLTGCATWSGSSVAYVRGNIVIYSGTYYLCEVNHTSTATTPAADFYHWTGFSPVNTTTCSTSGAALTNTSNATLTLASTAGFSSLGGIRQIGSAVITYTGVSGSTITGVNTYYTGATYTTTGTDAVIPIAASNCGTVGGTIHGGFAGNAVVGDWHHGINVASTTLDSNIVLAGTVCKGFVGDGIHVTSWVGSGAQVPSNLSRYINCFPEQNWGTGFLGNGPDSAVVATNANYNGLGGICLTTTASLISDSCKAVNNGTVPIFNAGAVRQVTDGVTNGTTTLTSATASFTADDIGQGIYDAGNTQLGSVNWIVDVVNATTVTLKVAAVGSATGLTLTIGGFFFWPTGTGASTASPTSSNSPLCVDLVDGNAYLLRVTSVGGSSFNNTPPSSDPTNWQPIRLATEWRWQMAMAANPGVAAGELSIRGDCQNGIGGVLLSSVTGSIADVTTSGIMRNPSTGRTLTTVPSCPSTLLQWTTVGLSSANNNLVRVANNSVNAQLYLATCVSSTGNTIEIATPTGSAGNLFTGGSFSSNLVIIRGVFVAGAPGNVTSVFGRTGAVVAAGGDYTASQVTNALDLSSASTQTMSGTLAMAAQQITFSGSTGAAINAGSRRIQATFGGVGNPTSLTPWEQVFGSDLNDNGASGASVNSYLGGNAFGTLAGANSVNLGTQVSAVLGIPHGGTGSSTAANGLANLGGLPLATFQKITSTGFTALAAGTWKITAVGSGGGGGGGAVGIAGQVGGAGGGAGGAAEDYYVSPGNTTAAGTAGALSWTGVVTAGSNIAFTGSVSVGDIVSSGSNVPIGTYVTAVAGSNCQLSAATTGTGTAVTQSGIYVTVSSAGSGGAATAQGGTGGDTTVTANAVTSWLDAYGGAGGAGAASASSTVVGGGMPSDRLNNSTSLATFPGVGGPSGKRPGSYYLGLTCGGGGGFGATGTVGGTGGTASTGGRSFLPATGAANGTSSGTAGGTASANTGAGGGGGGAAFTGGTAGVGGGGGSGFAYVQQVA